MCTTIGHGYQQAPPLAMVTHPNWAQNREAAAKTATETYDSNGVRNWTTALIQRQQDNDGRMLALMVILQFFKTMPFYAIFVYFSVATCQMMPHWIRSCWRFTME